MVDKRTDELVWLRNHLEADGNDLLREMVRSFAAGPDVRRRQMWKISRDSEIALANSIRFPCRRRSGSSEL